MRRHFSKAAVWQHFTEALILLGAGTTGSLNLKYARYHQLHSEAEWDWTIPDQWYDQGL